ncbi:MAG: DMT family protein [Kiritimatiellia bacterium]
MGLSVAQLRVIAEAVSLIVLIPFSIYFMHEKPRLDYLWAFLCLVGAVYFVNRANF